MPEMSGIELLTELKRLRPGLPGILMSGFAGPALQAEAQAAGAQLVLAKPLTQADLAHALAEVLGGIADLQPPARPAHAAPSPVDS